MKIKLNLPIVFIAISGVTLLLGAYILVTKTSLQPQLLISACGEVLKNIGEHLHLNPDGLISTLILLTTLVGISLTLWQLLKFSISHWQLHKLEIMDDNSSKLQWVINKHNLEKNTFHVIDGDKLTAYTTGLIKRRIVVSKLLVEKLTKKQLEAVILHELHHLRSHHVLWLLGSRLISSRFFFIPLIEHLAKQLRIEFELTADAFVVEKQKTRNYLCDSLALNLQYAGNSMPNFTTSPIEKRVEYLVDNKLSLDWIGFKQLTLSVFSLSLMLGIAFVRPNQISANSESNTGIACVDDSECQTTDCSSQETKNKHYFTPLIPASFSFTSSR